MKRLAVYLRGHRRTWNFTKENIFKFCDSLADKVDYYVAVWASEKDYFLSKSVEEDFQDKRLRTFFSVTDHWKYDAWTGPAYLASLLNQKRFEIELQSNIKYDAVLDTRFDVVFKSISASEVPPPWHIGTTRFEPEMVRGWKGLEDHCFLMSPATNVLWNNRVDYHKKIDYGCENGSHSKFYHYALNYGLTPYNIKWFDCKIIRPTALVCNEPLNGWNCIGNPYIIDDLWQQMSVSEKVDIVLKSKISLGDYLANLDLAY